jgi:hypothetical protein
VFTPARLTPLVRNQAEKNIPYLTEIGEVELTLFSTFPRFGIRVNGLAVISPGTGAPSDTLARADAITGVIDAKAFWKDRQLMSVNSFFLTVRQIFSQTAWAYKFRFADKRTLRSLKIPPKGNGIWPALIMRK